LALISTSPRAANTVPRRIARGMTLGLSRQHAQILSRLETPGKIQDFVTALPTNFEQGGDTCLSVAETLRHNHAHCIEGAFVAACALWINGDKPLLMDFQAEGDDDHVITLFKRDGHWGAISKTNHIWLRWRDPIYRSLRELALSYFHEYVVGNRKTLRRYSRPYDLRYVDPALWITRREHCWEVAEAIDEIRHYPLISRKQAQHLRRRDAMEERAGRLLETPAPDPKAARRY
jgi:hypothetical protein